MEKQTPIVVKVVHEEHQYLKLTTIFKEEHPILERAWSNTKKLVKGLRKELDPILKVGKGFKEELDPTLKW